MATGNIRGGQMAIGANGIVHVAWIGSSAALPRAAANSALFCMRVLLIQKITLRSHAT